MESDKKGYVDVVTPLMNGFLTGQLKALFFCCNRFMFLELAQFDPILKNKVLHLKHFPHIRALKRDLLCEAICSTASLGTFEILSKWVRNGKEGRPLGLNQGACCGLISGATAMFIWQPLSLAYNRVGLQQLTYTNWLTTLSYVLKNETPSSLWRGSGTQIAAYMGMLASYDPTFNYLTHTGVLTDSHARIGASITSGFFTAASSHSFQYLGIIAKAVQTRIQEGERHAYRYVISRCIRQVLSPNSGFNFYDGFLKRFRHSTTFCMVQYYMLEAVRKAEWTS